MICSPVNRPSHKSAPKLSSIGRNFIRARDPQPNKPASRTRLKLLAAHLGADLIQDHLGLLPTMESVVLRERGALVPTNLPLMEDMEVPVWEKAVNLDRTIPMRIQKVECLEVVVEDCKAWALMSHPWVRKEVRWVHNNNPPNRSPQKASLCFHMLRIAWSARQVKLGRPPDFMLRRKAWVVACLLGNNLGEAAFRLVTPRPALSPQSLQSRINRMEG